MTAKYESQSEKDTRAIASQLASTLTAGTTLLLMGDLGAGKTAFVKGLAEGLGVAASDVTSPTFTLVHEYRGGRLPMMHVDLYRLDRADLDELGMDMDLADQGVVAIEWAERLISLPPAIHVRITDQGGARRTIEITRS